MSNVSPGQSLKASPLRSAAVVNDVLAAAAAHKQTALGEAGRPLILPQRDPNIIWIKNVSGEDLKRGQVLEYGDYLLDYNGDYEEDNYDIHNPWFEGFEADPPYGKLAVLADPLKADDIGPAYIGGVCPLLVDVPSDIEDPQDQRFAIHNGGFSPVVCECGTFELLQKPGSGTHGLARLLWARFIHTGFLAKSTTTITDRTGNAPGTGQVKLWGREPTLGTLMVDTGIERTVYNMASADIVADRFLQLKWICNELLVDVEYCQ